MANQDQKASDFRALHEGEPFVIPNPWDAGSARVLEGLGFKALATTSSGFAFTLGRLDGNVTLDEVAEHARELDRAAGLPVSVDLENGYGPEPEDAATAIIRAAGAGAVGGSIEDFDPDGHLYALDHAVERVAAAVEAVRSLSFPFTLTARAENQIRGNPDLDDTIARLQAFERAGADVLYAPGLRNGDEIRSVTEAVSKPVNVLARPGLSMSEIAAAGGQRVSVGGGLTWVGVAAMVDAAEQIRDGGDFSSLAVRLSLQDWLAPLMPRYAAFLRGVNLGARRKVGSADLRACFEGAGLEDVQTFRTSGNVVFGAGRASRERLAERIETALAERFGFDVSVFLRTSREVQAIAAHEPFPANLVAASKGKLQVSMLAGKPSAAARKRALGLATDDDRLAFAGRELYWLPAGGTHAAALDGKAIEQLVGPSTMRTKGTVELLAARFF